MKIVVFKGGLGNQLFQYAFYKYLSRKDETFYFYNDAWYNVSHNGFELDKYFKTDDLKKCSRFWIILFKTILSKLYHWKIYVVGSVEYQYPNHLKISPTVFLVSVPVEAVFFLINNQVILIT